MCWCHLCPLAQAHCTPSQQLSRQMGCRQVASSALRCCRLHTVNEKGGLLDNGEIIYQRG